MQKDCLTETSGLNSLVHFAAAFPVNHPMSGGPVFFLENFLAFR